MAAHIDLVRDGYDLARADGAHQRELLRRVHMLLGDGLGAFAFSYQVRRHELEVEHVHLQDSTPALQSLVNRVTDPPPHVVRPLFVNGPPSGTLSAVARRGFMPPPLVQSGLENYRAMGAEDCFALMLRPNRETGMMIGVPLRALRPDEASQQSRWERTAAHLTAGLRLRTPTATAAAEAVIQPTGSIVHAEGPARGRRARERLRTAVLARQLALGDQAERPDDALASWRALVAGRWSLLDSFESDGRHYIVARKNEPGVDDPRGLTRREAQAADLLAFGHANKLIAYELGLSVGRVGALVASIRGKLGARSRAQLVTLLRRLRER